jgi:hypothetical protein
MKNFMNREVKEVFKRHPLSLFFFDFFDFEVKYSSSGRDPAANSLKDVKTPAAFRAVSA